MSVVPFGARLAAAMDAHGPLCVGIDPHASLLEAWGLPDSPAGLREFSSRVLEAVGGRVAAVKPQAAFFERHGSAGLAVLEEVVAAARETGTLSIVDAKRGDIGSTMGAYAEAFLRDGSPLAGDALTVSPFLGFGSLAPAVELATATGRGLFVLCLTSNPEGASVQHARRGAGADTTTVAASIAASARVAFSFASASAVALCAFFSFSSSTSSFSLSSLADFASSSDDSARARSAAKSPIAWAPAFSAVRTSSSDASSGRPKI